MFHVLPVWVPLLLITSGRVARGVGHSGLTFMGQLCRFSQGLSRGLVKTFPASSCEARTESRELKEKKDSFNT